MLRTSPMPAPSSGALAFSLALASALLTPAFAADHAGLDLQVRARLDAQVRASLREGIDLNLSGDYDGARARFDALQQVDPTHPGREFYLATVLFWRMNPDQSDPQYDDAIFALLQRSIARSEARLERDAADLEALHFLGLAYTYRGRLDAQRGRLYKGGTSGEKGRDFLERAIALCQKLPDGAPEKAGVCEDVWFPFGAYSYYAGRLPGLLRMLSFLWFVPRGSREEGLAALNRALQKSGLHQRGLHSLLASIESNFEEGGAPRAVALSRELLSRFPDNPYFDAEHANFLNRAGDHAGAEAWARLVLEKVRSGRRNYTPAVELMAELALAESLVCRDRLAEADALLARLRANPRFQRTFHTSRISLLQGMLADLRGDRESAKEHYRACKRAEGRISNRQAARQSEKYLDEPFTRTARR